MQITMNENCLNDMISGKKQYEAKLNKGQWKDIDIGNKITVINKNNKVVFEVSYITHYLDFKDAFLDFGEKLIPNGDLYNTYNKYYSREEIEKYGVILIKLEKI